MKRGSWLFALAVTVVLVVVAVVVAVVVLVGRGDGAATVDGTPVAATSASATSPEPTRTRSSVPPSAPEPGPTRGEDEDGGVPGWQTVTYLNASYDVPPDWEIQTATFSDGRTWQQPIYRKGFCPGYPRSHLAIVYLAAHPVNDAKEAVAAHFELALDRGFAGRSPTIAYGKQTGEADSQVRQGALVTATATGPCEAAVTALYVIAVKYPGDNGCFIVEVRAAQGLPDAVPEQTVVEIVNSFRINS